jgi:3-hydroxyacyl-CoA dehydrogenase
MIRSVAVLGAGTMGAQIAAHVANAGVPAFLLDVDRRTAAAGLDRAGKLRPDPFVTPDARALVTTGGIDEDLARIAGADWIVEAVVERADVKRSLLERVDAVRRPGSIVSSNTSGISIAALADGRSEDFRRHWLGTHFFNPPRYLHLVELVPGPDTDPAVVEAVARFADRRLGKGTVVAKDTPNFIANHIGMYGVLRILEAMEALGFTIEEVDAMTGPAIGRPKSATFRTIDITGLDVLAHVAGNMSGWAAPEAGAFALPRLVGELIARGWVGEKAGRGFYMRQTADGASAILTLDPSAFEYRPRRSARLGPLDAARAIGDAGERIRSLFLGQDRVGEFMRRTLGATLVYTALVAPQIAHGLDDVDRAMRWGYGWELGPFETWDAIGLREVIETCGVEAPPIVRSVIESGRNRFRDAALPPAGTGVQILGAARAAGRVVRGNPGASLIDLDEGVLAIELHSKMNAIGGDTLEMIHAGVKEASKNFRALVVGSEARNFSAGANLLLLLLEAQEGNWEEVDLMVRAFQAATMALRYADVPVVVAPAGLALGGGCELVLHADRVQAAAETYMGLVETGVGLIPAGGGTKEMIARALEGAPPGITDTLPFFQAAFETMAFGKVSTSGPDARRLGYLRSVDGITMNTDRLIADAKARAIARAEEGYQRPAPRAAIPVGGEAVLAPLKLGVHLAWRAGRISDHDALVGRTLAWVVAGGSLPQPARVSEQYLLDLEREAFLSLCGEPKTLERIAYTLKTGKPLRN